MRTEIANNVPFTHSSPDVASGKFLWLVFVGTERLMRAGKDDMYHTILFKLEQTNTVATAVAIVSIGCFRRTERILERARGRDMFDRSLLRARVMS